MNIITKETSKAPKIVLIFGLILVGSIFLASTYLIPGITEKARVETIDQAKEIVDEYLDKFYSSLQVDEIMEFTNHYYIRVVETSTNIGALELLIDRNTGRIYFEPGPSMMWNTKYGHMYQDSNATGNLTVTQSEALLIAQNWLEKNVPGMMVDEAMGNYGYYTLDYKQNNTIKGMLSVNGDNGDVWYHSWHGTFISEMTYE